MGGSGVIYAVLVGLWAAYLIPLWLRHRDDTTADRSIDRFHHAMHTLSRRTPMPGTREVVVPRRASQPLRPDGEQLERAARAEAERRARSSVAVRRSLAARRRRTLLALAVLTLVTAAVAGLGLIDWAAPVGAGALTLLYLAHLRVEAQRAAELARRRGGARRRQQARQRWDEVARVARREPVVAPVSGRSRPAAPMATRPAVPAPEQPEQQPEISTEPLAATPLQPATAAATLQVEAMREVTTADGDTFWEPVPVPLPTYVTAPKAVRPSRVIDLTRPGAWSQGQALDQPLAADEPFDQHAEAASEQPTEPAPPQSSGNGEEDFGSSRWVVND